MDYRYQGPLPSAAVINERIRAYNHILRAVSQWREPPLDCAWPVLVKDNVGVTGLRATAGSYALKALKSKDAHCIKNLRAAGATPFGKTTMSELAGFLSTTLPPGYSELGGQGINPINERFTPGGSSSGSAIAVAAGFCHAAVATETHGSIVIPSIACGVVGYKPTVGMVSRNGVIPISHTLDSVGAIARDVIGVAKLVQAMAGHDKDDPATLDAPESLDLTTGLGEDQSPLKLALAIPDYRALDPEERRSLNELTYIAQKNNIEIVPVPLKYIETHYKTISSTEIQGDFDQFLAKYGNGNTPGTFKGLVRFYEMRHQHHPFGMDRLTDSLSYNPDLKNPVYQAALKEGVGNCTAAIESLLERSGAQGVICLGFLPFFDLARAPCVSIPLTQRASGAMLGITIGAPRWQDRQVLDWATRLLSAIRNR